MNPDCRATEITEKLLDKGKNEKWKIMVNMVKFECSTGESIFKPLNPFIPNLLGEITVVAWVKRSVLCSMSGYLLVYLC
jgi:hypothetical protein